MLPINLPEHVICRPGAISCVPDIAGTGGNILLAASPSAVKSGKATNLQEKLAAAGNMVILHSLPSGEPELETVQQLADMIHSKNISLSVALGGGSTIDACKCACIVPEGDNIRNIFYRGNSITTPGIRLIAIPTTFGTGAEVTPNGVLCDRDGMVKQSVRGPAMLPFAAVVDSTLGEDAPVSVKASSGMDALVQAIEAAVSIKADNFSHPIAVKAASMLLENLVSWTQGSRTSGSIVAEASLLAGIALAHSGLGAVHGLAHPLGIRFNIPHGKACALLMGAVMQANAAANPEIYNCLPGCIERFSTIRQTLYGTTGLKDCGVTENSLPEIVRNSRSGSMRCNPVEYTDDELKQILVNAM